MILFSNDLQGTVLSRPNRFIILAETKEGPVRAHCPNPGRMEELIYPGANIILEKRPPGGKTTHSVEAVMYKKHIIPLNSQKTNSLVKSLILPKLFPQALTVKSEHKLGSSRFDFLVTDRRSEKHLIEVKSCTLVENTLALFPDAPSERALRHLDHLLDHLLDQDEYRPLFIFAVMNCDAEFFAPNRHTQPAWASALYNAKGLIDQRAFKMNCRIDGTVELKGEIPVIYPEAESAEKDSGIYVITMNLAEDKRIEAGKLGALDFRKGYYLYAGKAMGNLTSRMARHCRRRKNRHWHIDYLRKYTDQCRAWPIRTTQDQECQLADSLGDIYESDHRKFGSSDCRCFSHLFYSPRDPALDGRFITLINSYRHSL